jgi:MmyB-like transcription regulator ligand binding domain
MTDTPATVHNSRLDILAANRLGYALYSDIFADPQCPANHVRSGDLELEFGKRDVTADPGLML